MNLTEDNLRQAAAGMQTTGILSEQLEDGELEEQAEMPQASLKGGSKDHVDVSGKRMQIGSTRLIVVRDH